MELYLRGRAPGDYLPELPGDVAIPEAMARLDPAVVIEDGLVRLVMLDERGDVSRSVGLPDMRVTSGVARSIGERLIAAADELDG